MTDAREALARLVRTLDAKSAEDQERLGRYWDNGLADGAVQEDVYRRTDAILAEFDVAPRGEHVKPSVEDVAKVLFDAEYHDIDATERNIEWGVVSGTDHARKHGTAWHRQARAVLALFPGRTEAEVMAEGWDEGFADGYRQHAEGEDGPRFTNPYRADNEEEA